MVILIRIYFGNIIASKNLYWKYEIVWFKQRFDAKEINLLVAVRSREDFSFNGNWLEPLNLYSSTSAICSDHCIQERTPAQVISNCYQQDLVLTFLFIRVTASVWMIFMTLYTFNGCYAFWMKHILTK